MKSWEAPVGKSLKTIAVDLTPVLPGGANGGAKIFVLELLQRLSAMFPSTQFNLLTQAQSHEELASMDRSNMRRIMVVGPAVTQTIRPRLMGLASRILPHLPLRLRGLVNRLGYSLHSALKRSASGGLLHDMGADLLFCPFTAPTYFEPGIPTVCTIYDLQYKTYPEFFAPEDVAHRDRTFADACRKASGLTAISDYSRDSAIAHGKLDPAKIRTIHLRMANRFDPHAVHDKSVLARLNLQPQRYFIYPANFWKHKNHEMLLTAFGMACHQGLASDFKLVCTGSPGDRQSWLAGATQRMHLANRVVFPGYIPGEELAALIAHCGGVVFPSLYEGFGLPVVEAMAAGVPVACSNITSLPEVAAGAAILFDPRVPSQIAQALLELAAGGARQDQLVQAGLARAQEFADSQRMANEYWSLFQQSLSNEISENLLTGVYPDGWTGPLLNLQVTPSPSPQMLEMEVLVAQWMPQPKVTLQVTTAGRTQGVPTDIARGAAQLVVVPLSAEGGVYQVQLKPHFVPSQTGHGDDHRQLSAMLQRCVLKRAGGEEIDLLGESRS